MKQELNRDWTEFLRALISRRVRFVIVGEHAVAGRWAAAYDSAANARVPGDLADALAR